MSQIQTAADIKESFANIAGFMPDVVNWTPVQRCSTRLLPAAVIAPTTYFDTGRNLPNDNIERAREMPFDTVLLGFSWQAIFDDVNDAEPLIPNVFTIFREGEWTLTVDNNDYPEWPACCVPGAGGINAKQAPITANPATQNVSNGLAGNEFRMYFQPIAISQRQNFNVTLRSSALTALSQPTKVRFTFHGIEARRVI